MYYFCLQKRKGYSSILNQIQKINKLFPKLKIDCYGYGNFDEEFGDFKTQNLRNIKFYPFKKIFIKLSKIMIF